MSRSVHTTRQSLAKLRKKKFPSEEMKQAALAEAREELWQKRRIKREVSGERRRATPPLVATAIETIPIEVLDAGPFVHHGASPADLRTILGLLPDVASEGIASIRLSLGREYIEESSADEDARRDPFTGRCSSEIFPRVYGGDVLGTYAPGAGRVSVFAFVFDPARLPLPERLCTFYLRLHALKTFVHEVAHHHDEVCRKARGRWRSDRQATFENYAEKMEHEWTLQIVLPYLERTYPQEAHALRKWVAHRGGLMVRLEFFAGDCRKTERDGMVRLVFSTSDAFESWVEEVAAAQSLDESRLAFAWELHYADAYEDCLALLEKLLACRPGWIAALNCKADTLLHLERLDEVLACAEQVLRMDACDQDAWENRGDVFEAQGDWAGLLENCARWEASGKLSRLGKRKMLLHRAVAHCALGNVAAMRSCHEACVALHRSRSEDASKRHAAFLFRGIHRRADKELPESTPVTAQ